MSYGLYFARSVFLTLVVEVPVLFVLLKYLFKTKIPAKQIIIWGIFASLFSLPYLWFVFPLFTTSGHYIYFGEILVVLIEMIIYILALKLDVKKALLVSFVTNLASYLIGSLIR